MRFAVRHGRWAVPTSRAEFKRLSGVTEYRVLKHFPSWREAVWVAGLEPHSTNMPIDPQALLEDRGEFVRAACRIPRATNIVETEPTASEE